MDCLCFCGRSRNSKPCQINLSNISDYRCIFNQLFKRRAKMKVDIQQRSTCQIAGYHLIGPWEKNSP